jgi:hypothetical protein
MDLRARFRASNTEHRAERGQDLRWETSVGMSAAAPMAALPLLLLTVPTGLDQLYNPKRRGNRGWI